MWSPARLRLLRWFNVLLIVCLLILRLYRSPSNASNLEVVPDSVEYVVGADRIIHEHQFNIVINGHTFPSRYSPWFSLFLLTPLQAPAPHQPGIGIIAELSMGCLTAWCAFEIARLIAGPIAAIFAVLLLVFNTQFVNSTREIMTDTPAVALMALLCLVYVKSNGRMSYRTIVAAGLLVAFATAIRGMSILLLAPFLYSIFKSGCSIRKMAALVAPVFCVIVATACFNRLTYGYFARGGYSYWCAVPYDFPSLIFSLRYLPANLMAALTDNSFRIPFGLAALLWVFSPRREFKEPMRRAMQFCAFGVVPILFGFMFYFFTDVRFFLPFIVLTSILAAAEAAALIHPLLLEHPMFQTCLLVFAIVLCFPRKFDGSTSSRYQEVLTFDRLTPTNAVLISSIDPVYLEYLYRRNSDRYVLPISRSVEFADKYVSPVRVDRLDPPPNGPFDHLAAGLVKAGSYWAVPFTADENLGQIDDWVQHGRPVYVDLDNLSGSEDAFIEGRLKVQFDFEPVPSYPHLVQLKSHAPKLTVGEASELPMASTRDDPAVVVHATPERVGGRQSPGTVPEVGTRLFGSNQPRASDERIETPTRSRLNAATSLGRR